MLKVLSIFGTRPEAIKMAPVLKELEKQTENFKSIVCVTSQHRQMLDQVLNLFEIVPDYDLNIMQENQTLYDITANVIQGLKKIIESVEPDIVLVQGDTTTTFIGSLAAFYSRTPVGHVEAGLRTKNKYHPYPEEINRRLTTQIADLHFTPTQKSRDNLIKEGVKPIKIFITGNTVIDALLMIVEKQNVPHIQKNLEDYFRNKFNISLNERRKIILITGHRRENFGQDLENICNAIKEIATSYNDVDIVYPVHLNPNVQIQVKKTLNNLNNIYLIEPLDYNSFVYLMSNSYLIVTDSGGVQEEAPSLGKPVLVTRETTERPEAVEAGTVRLVGTDRNKIVDEINGLLNSRKLYNAMSFVHNPYGDGKAAGRIISTLLDQQD